MAKAFWRYKGYIGLIVLLIMICAAPVIFIALFWRIPEWQTESMFRVYPNAYLMFDVRAYDQGHVGTKIIYYWSHDKLSQVENYYERFYRPFKSGNTQNQWLITAFNNSNTDWSVPSQVGFTTYLDVCGSAGNYDCVSLALVDLSKYSPEQLPVAKPEVGLNPRENYENSLASLPHEGTLVVYQYGIANWS